MAVAAGVPTMKDVAAEAGVSKALVSLVFRDAPGASAETRARVLAAADRLGYRTNRAARLLAQRRSRLLGVSMVISSSYQAELVEAVQDAADAAGYEIVLSPVTSRHGEERAVEALLEHRCEALLLLGPALSDVELAALAAQLPVVLVGRWVTASGLDVVRSSEQDGMRQVIEHLTGLGHRRISHVRGGDDAIAADRARGYTDAMAGAGLGSEVDVVKGGRTERSGVDAAERLLALPELPSAVTVFNDQCALGVLDRLSRAGVDVPGRVSLVGYDDSPVSRLAHVGLTTVSQEPQEQGRLAVQAAVDRLDAGRTEPAETVLRPDLLVRTTTGPAADSEEPGGSR